MSEVKNPCINVCRTDKNGICLGCKRSLEEIGDWSKYSNEQKISVLENISQEGVISRIIMADFLSNFFVY
jgi:hypothetical protein